MFNTCTIRTYVLIVPVLYLQINDNSYCTIRTYVRIVQEGFLEIFQKLQVITFLKIFS